MIEQALLIHGSHGSPGEHWFPWLRDQLHHRSIEVFVPQFPILEQETLANWTQTFAEFVPTLDSKTILISHGTGGIFVLRVLQEASNAVHSAFLVAPPATNAGGLPQTDDPFLATFLEKPFDWPKIRANALQRTLITSSNDPYVPLDSNVALAHELEAKHIVLPNAGHLDESIKLTQFPALLAEIEQAL